MDVQSPRQTSEKPLIEEKQAIEEIVSEKTPQHEINKTALIVGGVAVAALLFMALR